MDSIPVLLVVSVVFIYGIIALLLPIYVARICSEVKKIRKLLEEEKDKRELSGMLK